MSDKRQYDDAQDPRLVAAVKLVRRTGARTFTLRYSDDEEPTVWMAVGEWLWRDGGPVAKDGETRYEVAAALTPLVASMRLLDQIVDGGTCAHCGKTTAVSDNWQAPTLLDEHICWYVYDPELQEFRRSCEGEADAR